MAPAWALAFGLVALGRAADDAAALLQARWAGGEANIPALDSFVAQYKIIQQELNSLTDLARKANATKKQHEEAEKKAKKGHAALKKEQLPALPDPAEIQRQVRLTARGFDLLQSTVRQVKSDQKAMLEMTRRVQERVYEPITGEDGLDAEAADEELLVAAAGPLKQVLQQYKKSFSRITANEKPLSKKVQNFYNNGNGQEVRQMGLPLIQPLTEERLDDGLDKVLTPLNNSMVDLDALSNETTYKDRRAAFRQVGRRLHVAAARSHKELDQTIAMADSGRIKQEFDRARGAAQIIVGAQIFNKAWSVISTTLENSHTQLQIMDNLAGLVRAHSESKEKKQAASPSPVASSKAAKGKKTAAPAQKAKAPVTSASAAKGKKLSPKAKAPVTSAPATKGKKLSPKVIEQAKKGFAKGKKQTAKTRREGMNMAKRAGKPNGLAAMLAKIEAAQKAREDAKHAEEK